MSPSRPSLRAWHMMSAMCGDRPCWRGGTWCRRRPPCARSLRSWPATRETTYAASPSRPRRRCCKADGTAGPTSQPRSSAPCALGSPRTPAAASRTRPPTPCASSETTPPQPRASPRSSEAQQRRRRGVALWGHSRRWQPPRWRSRTSRLASRTRTPTSARQRPRALPQPQRSAATGRGRRRSCGQCTSTRALGPWRWMPRGVLPWRTHRSKCSAGDAGLTSSSPRDPPLGPPDEGASAAIPRSACIGSQ
mmetsp:Transcript_120077/g.346891  ORF Transcript_120077/g.346891 Transcript_120077/m.346891 type:complete len:250 (+) Transcript_120077:719-1468(+)